MQAWTTSLNSTSSSMNWLNSWLKHSMLDGRTCPSLVTTSCRARTSFENASVSSTHGSDLFLMQIIDVYRQSSSDEDETNASIVSSFARDPNPSITFDELADTIVEGLLAPNDGTAGTFMYELILLAMHPEIQSKAREEIQACPGKHRSRSLNIYTSHSRFDLEVAERGQLFGSSSERMPTFTTHIHVQRAGVLEQSDDCWPCAPAEEHHGDARCCLAQSQLRRLATGCHELLSRSIRSTGLASIAQGLPRVRQRASASMPRAVSREKPASSLSRSPPQSKTDPIAGRSSQH